MMKLSICLIIALFISASLCADGVQPEGSGTQADPYQVEILDNLLWISTNSSSWSSYFIQTADIDASDTQNWNNGEGFSPIGIYSDNPFTGSYNGEEHIISHLYIFLPDNDNIGFFGYIEESAILNLGLENLDVTGNQGVGGFAGWNETSLISNCYATGYITGNQEVGGLVGYNNYSMISFSYTEVSVTGNGNNSVGGLVGFNNDASTIVNCHSISSLSGNDDVGGIAGMNIYSTISNSFSTCDITGNDCLGGLVGDCYESFISNSYSKGSVIEGNSKVGGLVGINISCPIINSYSTSCVIGNNNVGGLIGYIGYPNVQNSFWDIQISGQTTSAGGTGKTTAEMLDVATYTDLSTVGLDIPWDFVGNPFDDTSNEDYWDIDGSINNGYPYLANPLTEIYDEEIIEITEVSKLIGNHPNPFNPSTTISFSIQNNSNIELSIYNIKGQKVKQLVRDQFSAGEQSVVWDGRDENSKSVSSGIYFFKLNAGDFEKTKKMILIK